MSRSYIPEHVYGAIHDDNGRWTGEYGLVPWPAHLRPQETPDVELTKKGEAYVAAALAEADGVFFVTLSKDDRAGIATTIERLIGMLDAIDGDENLEETGDLEPMLGWPGRGPSALVKDMPHDDREGEAHWTDAGPMYELEQDDSDAEQSLGANEMPNGESQEHWAVSSWMDECEDVSEDEGAQDDREPNGDETDFDGGERDEPVFIPGGGSVSQHEDGWRPVADSAMAPTMVEKARRLKDGNVVREISAAVPPGAIPMLKAGDFDKLPWA
jgi:hypothetical protein